MAKKTVDFVGLVSRWADVLQSIPSPRMLDLVNSYHGLAGACCSFNANSVSNVTVRLFKGNRREENKEEIKQHPFLDLWDNPNPFMAGPQFIKTTQLYLELTGVCYWRIVNGLLSAPSELLILPPHQVTQEVENRQIVGYKYMNEKLSLDEVIAIYVANPLNPYGSGCGPTELAWEYIKLFGADTTMMYNLLIKGGRPGALISPEGQQGVISPGLSQRLQAWWRSFSGRNAGDAAVSPLPLKVDLLNVSSKEFQGSERLKDLKTLILNCYDIPEALFASSKSRAELDAAMVQYARLALDPRTSLLAGLINSRVVNLFDPSLYVEFDWSLREDELGEKKPDGKEPMIPDKVGMGEEDKPEGTKDDLPE